MTAPKRAASLPACNLTVERVAALADLSPNTIRNMIARGDLHAIKLGRAVRIPITECQRLGMALPANLSTMLGEAA